MTTPAPTATTGAWYPTEVCRVLIVHRTELTYPEAVTTSYNEIRMQPADEPGQSVLSSRLDLDPFEGVTAYTDYFGTKVASFDLHRPHRSLTVTATTTVETFEVPATGTPLSWEDLAATDYADRYWEFLAPTPLTELSHELIGRAQQIREDSATPTEAATRLCELVRQRIRYVQGATGVHTSALEVWSDKRGVCQDFSHLTTALIRAAGIPARYVSGYLHPDPQVPLGTTVTGQSHAWIEWFDGRWTAFDPTNGAPPGLHHVVVGRGRDYHDVPPMKGVYAGPGATGNTVTVTVTRLR